MAHIYYLKFTELALKTFAPSRKLINEHYVFSLKNKFYVMTSQPVKGLKSTLIHTTNIENQIGKKQYVIEHAHTYDIKYHILECTSKGTSYLIEHQEKFQAVLESIKQII